MRGGAAEELRTTIILDAVEHDRDTLELRVENGASMLPEALRRLELAA